jgi:hypothetical protein
MGLGQKAACALIGAWCVAALGGCGDGLGECDSAALGGNPTQGMTMPYEGQRIVAEKCSTARCHSVNAEGDLRVGAPAGLNFDVVAAAATPAETAKITKAVGIVIDWAENIWDEVEGGTMPPEAPAGSGELNDVEKEAVRNWLACGAPLIDADPTAPAATWDSIWPALSPNCVICHGSQSGEMAGDGFILGDDMCTAYANIFGQTALTSDCGMMPRTVVIASDPDNSLLVQKLTATQTCGTPMPPSAEGLQGINPQLVDTIKAWIAAGALKPASCP